VKFKEESPNAAFIRNLKDVVDTLLAEYEIPMDPWDRVNMVCSLWVSFMTEMGRQQNGGKRSTPSHLINVDWRDFMGMMQEKEE